MIVCRKQISNGLSIDVLSLQNDNGMSAKLFSYGATLAELYVPDRWGKSANVVLGYADPQEYFADHPFLGCIVGRFANRIANARFDLDGKSYQLDANDGQNTLHGGSDGFHRRNWQVVSIKDDAEPSVTFRYESAHLEGGFPGRLLTDVTYGLTNDNQLRIEYAAMTDVATPVNLTHHSYFNLDGAGVGDILGHELTIDADEYTVIGRNSIPTGEIRSVRNTAFDFTEPALIGDRIDSLDNGYDHNFVLNKRKLVSMAARVYHKESGRLMEMWTSEPGMQFYSGNYLDGRIIGNGGAYGRHAGFCLEAQHFPDSLSHAHFPSTILSPLESYRQLTVYQFACVR